MLLESDLETELARRERLPVIEARKPQWRHVVYTMLKQVRPGVTSCKREADAFRILTEI